MDHQYRRFDAVRGLAAIAVLLMHVIDVYVTRLTGADTWFVHVWEILARHAVLIFFLLSGYLITLSIILNVRKNGRFDGVQYLTSRISRIYPPLCGAMLIILVAWALIHGLGLAGAVHYGLPTDKYMPVDAFSVSGRELIRALLMQDGLLGPDPSLWSLYVEFHLYLIAMLGAMAFSGRGVLRYIWLVIGVLLFALWSYLWVWFIVYAIVWVLGAVAAVANSRPARLPGTARVSAAAAVVSALVLVGWIAVARDYDVFVVNRLPLLPGFVVQLLCCVCYTHLLFSTKVRNRAIPNALVATGNFSYSLYVIHYPLLLLGLSLAQNWMGNSLGRTLIVAIVSVPVALYLSLWFARYFEDQKRFSGPIRRVLLQLRRAVAGTAAGAARALGTRSL